MKGNPLGFGFASPENSGTFLNLQTFSIAGTYTYAPTSGMVRVKVTIVGATSGSGGEAGTSGGYPTGGDGGNGGTSSFSTLLTVIGGLGAGTGAPGSLYTISIPGASNPGRVGVGMYPYTLVSTGIIITVGAGGTAGTGGVSGTAGSAGIVYVEEYF